MAEDDYFDPLNQQCEDTTRSSGSIPTRASEYSAGEVEDRCNKIETHMILQEAACQPKDVRSKSPSPGLAHNYLQPSVTVRNQALESGCEHENPTKALTTQYNPMAEEVYNPMMRMSDCVEVIKSYSR